MSKGRAIDAPNSCARCMHNVSVSYGQVHDIKPIAWQGNAVQGYVQLKVTTK
jgi:hypothetical protein